MVQAGQRIAHGLALQETTLLAQSAVQQSLLGNVLEHAGAEALAGAVGTHGEVTVAGNAAAGEVLRGARARRVVQHSQHAARNIGAGIEHRRAHEHLARAACQGDGGIVYIGEHQVDGAPLLVGDGLDDGERHGHGTQVVGLFAGVRHGARHSSCWLSGTGGGGRDASAPHQGRPKGRAGHYGVASIKGRPHEVSMLPAASAPCKGASRNVGCVETVPLRSRPYPAAPARGTSGEPSRASSPATVSTRRGSAAATFGVRPTVTTAGEGFSTCMPRHRPSAS